MSWMVGGAWPVLHSTFALCALGLTLYFAYVWLQAQGTADSGGCYVIGAIFTLIAMVAFGYLAYYAQTHTRVLVNEKALVVYQNRGEIVGEYGPGIQPKPAVGADVVIYPSHRQFNYRLDLGEGTDSATSKDHIVLFVDVNVYLDLSKINTRAIYPAFGNWENFQAQYLRLQMTNLVRFTSNMFTVQEHETKRAEWAKAFDEAAVAFFNDPAKGFGIKFVPGTTMSFDFVNKEDQEAYDLAHRSSFLVMQRENEQQALEIEASMAQTRANMLKTTSSGAIESLSAASDFIQSQPPSVWGFLTSYMRLQVDLEYLRLIAQLRPTTIFPPQGVSAMPTYDVSQPVTPVPTVTSGTP